MSNPFQNTMFLEGGSPQNEINWDHVSQFRRWPKLECGTPLGNKIPGNVLFATFQEDSVIGITLSPNTLHWVDGRKYVRAHADGVHLRQLARHALHETPDRGRQVAQAEAGLPRTSRTRPTARARRPLRHAPGTPPRLARAPGAPQGHGTRAPGVAAHLVRRAYSFSNMGLNNFQSLF